jgi:hypothetical protein
MIDLEIIIRQLTSNMESIRALLESVPEAQAQWKPDAETWSLREVMEHVYNEERLDFRKHLKEMFHDPPQPWEDWSDDDLVAVESCRAALDAFISERKDSIAWLAALSSPDWNYQTPTPWRKQISAGDVLVSWVEHDFLHMRQFIEVLYAWNVQQAAPYLVEYAGDW